jgi:hypothetical protein
MWYASSAWEAVGIVWVGSASSFAEATEDRPSRGGSGPEEMLQVLHLFGDYIYVQWPRRIDCHEFSALQSSIGIFRSNLVSDNVSNN